jgi:hypothetical protein
MRISYFKKTRLVLLIFTFLAFTNVYGQTEGKSSRSNSEIKTDNKQPVDFVNPYIGNISHLLVPTYPTIHLPNSFLRVYPERGDFTGDLLKGLPLVVTSHRGSSAFNLSPFQGAEKDIKSVISYSYDQEKSHHIHIQFI